VTPVGLFLEIAAALFLYVVPGAAVLAVVAPAMRLDFWSRIGLAGPLSLAVYALAALWCWCFGFAPGGLLAWAPGGAGLAILAASRFSARLGGPRASPSAKQSDARLESGLVAVLVALIALSRFLSIRGMLAPAWGDSVQHAVITQLLLDHGGLFQSWAPYAPMESFTYHFGFHAACATWAWVTGANAPEAVLVVGQIVNVIAVVALYPLAFALSGGSRLAGAVALLVAGLLSPMPAFYVSWGRYTQLAGQAILPAFLFALDRWWSEASRPRRGTLGLVALLLAGLALTHYRVLLLAVAAVLAWSGVALWTWRREPREWRARAIRLGGACATALLAVSPWLAVLGSGILPSVHGVLAGIDPAVFSLADVTRAWVSIPARVPWWAFALIVAAVAFGALVRERVVAVALAWIGIAFLITNPFLVGLPGTGFVTNFAIGIAAYVPAALVLGVIGARALAKLAHRPLGRIATLAAAAALALLGFRARAAPVEPSFQLVTASDLRAFEWIASEVPPDARFLVNSFAAYDGSAAVGSDAGWWLPLYTGRGATLPPLPYTVERMPEELRYRIRVLPEWIRRTNGWARFLNPLLCAQEVTHVYLGERRGTVGTDGTLAVHEEWLRRNPRLKLLHEDGRAQIWRFDRSSCPHGR